MKVKCKIESILPPREGVSGKGTQWLVQPYIVSYMDGDTQCTLCVEVFGKDKVEEYSLRVGSVETLELRVDSREWQDRWFTTVHVMDVERPQKHVRIYSEVKREKPVNTPETELPF